MATAGEQWIAARANAKRMATVRAPTVDSCEIVARAGGGYHIVIRGTGLFSGAIPPDVRVVDQIVRDLVPEGDTVLRGTVAGGRPGDVVTVDLGPLGRGRGRVDTVR